MRELFFLLKRVSFALDKKMKSFTNRFDGDDLDFAVTVTFALTLSQNFMDEKTKHLDLVLCALHKRCFS